MPRYLFPTPTFCHCLRHPQDVREQLLRLFDVIKDSLWIPYQVGLEFHRNRLNVEHGSRNAYDSVTKDCSAAFDQARSRLGQLRAHPVINVEREIAAIDNFISDIRARMELDKQNHPTQAIADAVDRLTDLLDGRVGAKWSSDQFKALRREGEQRYANKIPPGYMDSKKQSTPNDKFGDLIVWKEMMTKATEEERPIVFISDDAKEDWWWIHRGQKLGARPELIEEFKEFSNQSFHIYEFGQFLRIAPQRHPEIREGVALIEESLRGDEQARRRHNFAVQAKALRIRVSELEHKRDTVISALAGTPMHGHHLDQSEDKSILRTRLDELNTELESMNADLIQITDSENQTQSSFPPLQAVKS